MELKTDYTEWSLLDALWSGGKENARRLAEAYLWSRAYELIEDIVEGSGGEMDLMSVNDMLWFDFDYLLESLGYKEDDDGNIRRIEDDE